jgi:YHS domain-containing protein
MFKDPVCNMMVDEKKAKFVSESGGGRKCIYAQQHARVSLKGILPSMAIHGKLFLLRHNTDHYFCNQFLISQLK